MPVVPIRWVLIRDPKEQFAVQALVCTDLGADPLQIVSWFVLRWQLETTFQAVRTHLGVETQRQWNMLAIARTTLALLGLFSLVTLLAHQQAVIGPLPIRQAAWYTKTMPTFADALATVRQQLWMTMHSCTVASERDIQKLQQRVLEQVTEIVCYTA